LQAKERVLKNGRDRFWWIGGATAVLALLVVHHVRASERAAVTEAAVTQMMQAAPQRQIYDVNADAHAEVAAALKQAKAEHKRVILDFGGNWCGDCKVLDINFHKPENQDLLQKYYLLVDIDIGRYDKNMDIGEKYGVPIKKGVPALAVVDGNGKVVIAQSGGEFADMRHMDPNVVHEFLEKWKPRG
jgi:thiol:disulfide interchange protein